ncbi:MULTISPECIES: undecaprenyl-diphosphate phosphatase [Gammaproteobacteria]|uniref:undecaprenyl-diphosphate phosphatase n=1 Tax=Gammaproteobacteria TaxID=1236 RepID=UPI000DD053F2|nr:MULTISPECIES: undecaprenyl-diphosphate phosphatase [Gammaproteobacteria]RTE86756.1 undecaprenyl-diphosphate phosphatase [Aliidiomarina sp. B3213]TCZ90690.1 undecaprenyl-diphosphate phosphatase [Lysobacter sp. N42]
MEYITAIILALVQGITEFLPVSSQAHLVLAGEWFGEVYQGLDFDVILHAGSLVAVVTYFRHELFAMAKDWTGSLVGGERTKDSKLAWWVIIGTIPAGALGILLKDYAETILRSPWIMATALIVFGLFLGLADWKGRGKRTEYDLNLKDVIVIGFSQALALIPGTSRSGITMTAALFLGMSREASARFSFLLSVPVIAAAGLLYTIELVQQGTTMGLGPLLVGFIVAVVSTYACIHYFLAFIKRIGMQPFVIYRVLLGLLIIGAVW